MKKIHHPTSQHKHSLKRKSMPTPKEADIENSISRQYTFYNLYIKQIHIYRIILNTDIAYYSIFYTKILRIRITALNSNFPINHPIFLICHLIKWYSQVSESQHSFVFLKHDIYNLGILFQLFPEDFWANIIPFFKQTVESSGAWQCTRLSNFLYRHFRMISQ